MKRNKNFELILNFYENIWESYVGYFMLQRFCFSNENFFEFYMFQTMLNCCIRGLRIVDCDLHDNYVVSFLVFRSYIIVLLKSNIILLSHQINMNFKIEIVDNVKLAMHLTKSEQPDMYKKIRISYICLN